MRKLLLCLLVLFSVTVFSQVTPKTYISVSTATTDFLANIPIGTQVVNIATGKVYLCITAAITTDDLTSASAKFTEIDGSIINEGSLKINNDLPYSVKISSNTSGSDTIILTAREFLKGTLTGNEYSIESDTTKLATKFYTDSKQAITDTTTKDATRYWVGQNYQPTVTAGYRIGKSGVTINNVDYWKNQDTLKTTLNGLVKATGGVLTAISDASTNWNTAFSWGDHANKYVPLARQLTINGTAYDLTANRTWDVGTLVAGDTASLLLSRLRAAHDYAPIVHSQGISTITNLQDSLNSKYTKTQTNNLLALKRNLNDHDSLSTLDEKSYNSLTDKPNITYYPSLQDTLNDRYRRKDTATVLLSRTRASHDYQPKGIYVTSIATTSPITGGTITSTGTIAIIPDTLAAWRTKQNQWKNDSVNYTKKTYVDNRDTLVRQYTRGRYRTMSNHDSLSKLDERSYESLTSKPVLTINPDLPYSSVLSLDSSDVVFTAGAYLKLTQSGNEVVFNTDTNKVVLFNDTLTSQKIATKYELQKYTYLTTDLEQSADSVNHCYYNITNVPITSTVSVWVNGMALQPTTQYTISTHYIRVGVPVYRGDKIKIIRQSL